jgi:flagellar operon protein
MVDKIPGPAPGRISPAELEARKTQGMQPAGQSGPAFADVLQATLPAPLRFSAHAQERLRARDIRLSERDTAELTQAVEMAGAKGAQESLILYDDLALIVSIRNRTVITALERGEQQANVFTHIDSAVVLPGSRS